MALIGLVVVLALGLALAPCPAEAQRGAKPWRVGYLTGRSDAHPAFRATLRELGYLEGQNLVLEVRSAQEHLDRLPHLAAELVQLAPDVVVAVGSAEAQAVKRATATIPIVIVVVPDPIGLGLVASLARPGGNVTGLTSTPGLELHGKRFELLRELAPGAVRIALLANPGNPATIGRVRVTEATARAVGVELRIVEVRTRGELGGAFATMKRQRTQGLMVPADPLFNTSRVQLAELAAQAKMPVVYGLREYVEAGGLVAYGPSYPDLFSQAARYVDRVLKGAKPADLPVAQPTKFELAINLKTAKALELTIPQTLLLRADQVIE